jgi:hypothetical protein
MSRKAPQAPVIKERDGNTFVVDRGHERPCLVIPGEKTDDDLLNYAAAAHLCRLTWPAIDQRQKRGWASNGCKPLPEVQRPVKGSAWHSAPFIRRGDLLRAIEPPSEGETRKRFLVDGQWVLVKGQVALILKGRENAPIDGPCKRLKLEFREVRSRMTGQPVKVCLEKSVINAKRWMDEQPRSATPPPIGGRESRWLADLLAEIRLVKTGKSRIDRRLGRATVIAWIKKGCWHLDGEKLHALREDGWQGRLYVDKEQGQRILESISAARVGKVHPGRQLLRPIEVEREYGIERNSLRHWSKHRKPNRLHLPTAPKIQPVKNAIGIFYWRKDIEVLLQERDTPMVDPNDGSRILRVTEAAETLNGGNVRQLRRAIQNGKLKSCGLAPRGHGILPQEYLLRVDDVRAFRAPVKWKPSDGFVTAGQIFKKHGVSLCNKYRVKAFDGRVLLEQILRDARRTNSLYPERHPSGRLPFYYPESPTLRFIEQWDPSHPNGIPPKRRRGRPRNEAQAVLLSGWFTTPGTPEYHNTPACHARYVRENRMPAIPNNRWGKERVRKLIARHLGRS